jgi:hypothetical protein
MEITSPPLEMRDMLPEGPDGMSALLHYYYGLYVPYAVETAWDMPTPTNPGIYYSAFGRFLGAATGPSILITGGKDDFAVEILADAKAMRIHDPDISSWVLNPEAWHEQSEAADLKARRALGWLAQADRLAQIMSRRPLPGVLASEVKLLQLALPELVQSAVPVKIGTQAEKLCQPGLYAWEHDTLLLLITRQGKVFKLIWEPESITPMSFSSMSTRDPDHEVGFSIENIDDSEELQLMMPRYSNGLWLAEWREIFDALLGQLMLRDATELSVVEQHVLNYLHLADKVLREQPLGGLVRRGPEGGVDVLTADPDVWASFRRTGPAGNGLTCSWGPPERRIALTFRSGRSSFRAVTGVEDFVDGAAVSDLMRLVRVAL